MVTQLLLLLVVVTTRAGHTRDLPRDDTLRWGARGGVALRAWASKTRAHILATTYTIPPEGGKARWVAHEQGAGHHTAQQSQQGLHAVVLHQRTANVVVRRVFLTQEPYTWWADLVWWLSRVAPGRLVVLTTSGRASFGLRHARLFLTHYGSSFVQYLTYDTPWCWAFVKGGRTVYEVVARGIQFGQEAVGSEMTSGSIFAEGLVHLLQGQLHPAANAPTERDRWQYCDAHGAMGGLCDEHSPDPLPPPTPAPVARQAALEGVPVVVTAGSRHQYLYHTLITLLDTPGALHHNVLVVLGDAPPPTTQLLRLLNLNFTSIPVHGHGNNKLFRYYRAVFTLLARSFSHATAAILLDEDVEVSPDFFSYFSQTLWLLHADPTLYCINAHSYMPNKKRGRGAQFVRRGAVQVSWGYAVTLDFVKEALRQWPLTAEGVDIQTYDYWIYDNVRGERECVFPEVSRLRHYGVGVNTFAYIHEYEAWRRPLLYASHVPLLNAAIMLHAPYEEDFLGGLREARTVRASVVCKEDFPLHAATLRRPLVVYFVKEYQEDISSWFELGKCAGLHAHAEQGHHAGAHLAFFPRHSSSQQPRPHLTPHPLNTYGFNYYIPHHFSANETDYNSVYFVGTPYSRYSQLRPRSWKVFDASSLTQQQLFTLRARFADPPSILLINNSIYNYHTLIHESFSAPEFSP